MKILNLFIMLFALISCGKNVEEESKNYIKPISTEYEDALYTAISSGDSTVVKSVLDSTKNIDKVFKENGETALTMSIKENRASIVRLILNKGANSSIKNNLGQSALHLSISSINNNISKLVIDKSSDFSLTNEQQEALVEYAINNNKQEAAIHCILKGSPVEQRTSTGIDLNSLAKRAGMHDLSLLITSIKNFKQKGESQVDIYQEIEKANIYFLKYVFAHGNVSEMRSNTNDSELLNKAITISDPYRRRLMVRLLIENGVNPKGSDPERTKPPIFTAIDQGHEYIVKFLIKKGVRLNTVYGLYKNPLSYAVKSANPRVVQELHNRGALAELNIYTENGFYQINSCSYLPRRRSYRNRRTNLAQRYRQIDEILKCD